MVQSLFLYWDRYLEVWYNGNNVGFGAQVLNRLTFKLCFAPYDLCDPRQGMNSFMPNLLFCKMGITPISLYENSVGTIEAPKLGSGSQEMCITRVPFSCPPFPTNGNCWGIQPQAGPATAVQLSLDHANDF